MNLHAHTHTTAATTTGSLIRWATLYDLFVHIATIGRATTLRETTVELAGVQSGGQVLEVGCGTGAVALAARRRMGAAGEVHGIDPSPEMITVARRKADQAGLSVEFRVGVVEALPFPDNTFEVVLSSLMMHHLPVDLKRPALAEIYRVLKPGGRLLVVDFKRPIGFLGRWAVMAAWHGALKDGVQDLEPAIRQAGFKRLETGDTPLGMLGYIRAWKESQ